MPWHARGAGSSTEKLTLLEREQNGGVEGAEGRGMREGAQTKLVGGGVSETALQAKPPQGAQIH